MLKTCTHSFIQYPNNFFHPVSIPNEPRRTTFKLLKFSMQNSYDRAKQWQ